MNVATALGPASIPRIQSRPVAISAIAYPASEVDQTAMTVTKALARAGSAAARKAIQNSIA